MIELPTISLKTKSITFDDRLQQVRIIEKVKDGYLGRIDFLDYEDDRGFFYLKKYREDWQDVIRL